MATPKKTTRKKAEPAEAMEPVQFTEEPVEAEAVPEDLPATEEAVTTTDEGLPYLRASSLVRSNEYARNSASVRAVQDALVERGHWEVGADPSGYWGPYTQDAAVTATGEEEPVAAARALGFTVV